jgi:hypothetical protein
VQRCISHNKTHEKNEQQDSSIMKQLLMVDDFTQMSAMDKFMEEESPL